MDKYRLYQIDSGNDHGDPYGVYQVLRENSLTNCLDKVHLTGRKHELLAILEGIKIAINESKLVDY